MAISNKFTIKKRKLMNAMTIQKSDEQREQQLQINENKEEEERPTEAPTRNFCQRKKKKKGGGGRKRIDLHTHTRQKYNTAKISNKAEDRKIRKKGKKKHRHLLDLTLQ